MWLGPCTVSCQFHECSSRRVHVHIDNREGGGIRNVYTYTMYRVVARGGNGRWSPPFLTAVLFDVVFKTTRML